MSSSFKFGDRVMYHNNPALFLKYGNSLNESGSERSCLIQFDESSLGWGISRYECCEELWNKLSVLGNCSGLWHATISEVERRTRCVNAKGSA